MTPALLLALSLSAAPPSLHAATQALDDLKYDEALAQLPPEDQISGYSREELIEWFSTRALALLSLKKEAEATTTFERLFAFAPEWVLPDLFGPRVQTLVSQIRAQAARNGVVSVRFEGGFLKTTRDKFGLAQALLVSWRTEDGKVSLKSLEPLEQQSPPWPRGQKLDVWATVVGFSNSTLVAWGSPNAPTQIQPVTVKVDDGVVKAGPQPAGLGGLAFAGIGALGGAAVAASLGVGFAVGSHAAEQALVGVTRDSNGRITSLSQRDAFALDEQAKGSATASGVFFAISGVLAAGGVALVVVDRVTAAPAPGGATVGLSFDATFVPTKVSR
ncbi:MAG: hypothetical protein U0228_10780 [Myxococcaceae bacterium]